MENLDRLSCWTNAAVTHAAAIKRFISDFIRRHAFREEIAQLERAGSLDTILDDLGMTRWEMNRIARNYPEADRLLPTMAYHRGVDLEKLDPHSLYALRHECSLCDAHRACRRWLSGGATTADVSFCPNAKLFGALQNSEPTF
ncbi:MAG TPA: DUF6455 family protein [Stellaceae bacterium]|nr:DUF6455 family protein [Stellaceae bacterium]